MESTKRCPRCGHIQPRSAFDKHKNRADGLSSWCKKCKRAYYRERNPIKKPIPSPGMKYCSKCGRELPLNSFHRTKQQKLGRTSRCKECVGEYAKKWYKTQTCVESRKRYNNRARELRIRVLKHLSGDPPKCEWCPVTDPRVLCIDHLHNNGHAERQRMANSTIYRKILKMPLAQAREQYQVLCRNCNWLRRMNQWERERKKENGNRSEVHN